MNDNVIDLVRFSILSPREHWPELAPVYSFWKDVWKSTLVDELKSKNSVFSDPFLNAHEIAVLHLMNRPVALIFLNKFDLTLQATRDLDYFSHYPRETFEDISALGNSKVITNTYLTVDPKFRRTNGYHLPLSDLMVGLALRRFAESDAGGTLAVTRNNRKVNEIYFRFGGTKMTKTGIQHNVPVDFVLVTQESLKEATDPFVRSFIDKQWIAKKSEREFRRIA